MPRRRPGNQVHIGTILKAPFTIARRVRYAFDMLMLAAAALAASTATNAGLASPKPTVQSRATVRIVSGASVRFTGPREQDIPRVRQAQIRTTEGPRRAQLIEFE
jgi:hypothetical protein